MATPTPSPTSEFSASQTRCCVAAPGRAYAATPETNPLAIANAPTTVTIAVRPMSGHTSRTNAKTIATTPRRASSLQTRATSRSPSSSAERGSFAVSVFMFLLL